MYSAYKAHLQKTLSEIKEAGLYKSERLIDTPQGAWIVLKDGRKVLNLCANNYLGLSSHPDLLKAAHEAIDRWGYGLSSVRFICGTQSLHTALEKKVSEFLRTDDTILYSSCFDANGGLFETLLTEQDAIISDQLNHASIIDGIRLCKAQRFRYANCDMADLEAKLKEASGARFKLIATDGVFSMDGLIAPLKAVCDLAEKYDALVMVDDSHAVGFMGEGGRGTPELCGVLDRIDILTGTFGKALGGASGGYTSGKKEIVELLRQRSRPYLFSNTLPPVVAHTTLKAIDLVTGSAALREKLRANTQRFRSKMTEAGFNIIPGEHPIAPIMLGDAKLAQALAAKMLEESVYVVGFFYPVVPQGKARIRTQISAGLEASDIDFAVEKFIKAGKELGIVK